MELLSSSHPKPHSWYNLCPGLIDGNAVWSDQQVSSFPPRDAVTGSLPAHPGTSNSHVQRNSKEPDKCEQFSPRRLSLWQSPPSPLLALTILLAHGSSTPKTRSTHQHQCPSKVLRSHEKHRMAA